MNKTNNIISRSLSHKSLMQRGYTLIEMIIVVTIIGVILPTIFTILFVILQQQMKIYRLIEVKKQGDFILSFIRNKIETDGVAISSSANGTTVQCASVSSTHQSNVGGDAFYFVTKNNTVYSFRVGSDNKLYMYNHTALLNTVLTTNKVEINNLTFSCFKRANLSTPLIQVSFTVDYNNLTNTPGPAETASLSYKTKLRLKAL